MLVSTVRVCSSMTAGSNWLSWAPPNFLSNLETEYAPDDTYSLLTVASLYCLAFRVGFSGRSCYGTARNQDNSRRKHETIHVEIMLSILTHRIYKINKYMKGNAINDINIVNRSLIASNIIAVIIMGIRNIVNDMWFGGGRLSYTGLHQQFII